MAKRNTRRNRGSNRERVREVAHTHRQKTTTYGLTIPEGVELWEPKQKGTYLIDVLPYEVTKANHPDGVTKGEDWYRRPFKVHFGIGVDNRMILCPTSVGAKCPICEEIKRLRENWDENKDQIRDLKAKEFVAFNIIDKDADDDSIKIFAYSAFKFAEALEEEIDEGDPENACFDNLIGGKTLKVRFTEDEFAGHTFLKATKIDFLDRDDYDESIMDEVVKLDEIIRPLSYDDIAKIFYGLEDEVDEKELKPKKVTKEEIEEEQKEEPEEKLVKVKKQKTTKKKTVKEPEPKIEEEPENDFDSEDFEKPQETENEEQASVNDDDDWGEDWD